ncbi:rRNA small subunit methyltransferase B [Salinibacterium sp. dk2585]|uniref:RsmB/NOP family class I SAM-dependent RNA methyltransferase n=1 Tax=unclassified Salinibacterium TaxID=2632331 RepID=UPI0011C24E3E|nr:MULTISPECIES: transcription antitermination factor NusB [unclassified Salinibacterium]QEE61263.1 rRNA small subunit methyltransferase B [Salinibacterium sp. dk2585]TXK53939.1 rRNA small subunit methyltransferase B [Salinibacterium sp. dk5596]
MKRSASGAPRQGSVQPARRVAYEVIAAVRETDAYANLLLPVKLERAGLHGGDAALATELTYGTLRQRGYYDAVIEHAAGRSVDKIDPAILDVLRLGTHQLLSMRVASHAAVDEAVSQARQVGSRSATGFVNGVLRTISRSTPGEWRDRVLAAPRSEDERLAVEHSHPVWVVRALRRALAAEGREHELEALLEADNSAPAVSLAALPGLSKPEELSGEPGHHSPFAVTSSGGDPARIPAIADGRARVQDEGSQLAALALSRVAEPRPGERWLDMCAGPGGKAALLAAEAVASGATLVANEVVPARAELVRRALAPISPSIQVTVNDGRLAGTETPGHYDRVLIDAPCTGLGALRRRPEARWRKQPKDVPALASLQAELLESGLKATRPGGVVAYVTCSPHLAETRAVLASVLKRHPDVERLDASAVLADVVTSPLDLGDSDGTVQLWPHRHGTDAMFISLLRVPR